MKKQYISFFLIFSLLFFLYVPSVNAAEYPSYKQDSDFMFEVEHTECRQGDNVSVPVKIKNNKGIWSGLFSVSFSNDCFETVAFAEGPLLNNLEYSKKITNKKMSLYFENKSLSDFKENGVLFYIVLKIKDNSPVTKVSFNFSGTYDADNFFNSDGNNVDVKFKNGVLSILESKYVMSTPVIKSVKLKTIKKVQLKYNKVKNATSYTIYRASGKSKKFKVIGKTKSSTFYDKKIKIGVTYKYKIKAKNSKKTTGFSSTKSIASLNYKKKVSFTGSLLSPTSVLLTVRKAPAGTIGYQVSYGNNRRYIGARTKTTKSKKITITGLNPDYEYCIRIRAYNIVNGKKKYTKWAE